MKILRVGDPHVMISNLSESEKFLDFIFKVAEQNKADAIELLGDATHNHAVLRQEVLDFWRRKLILLSTLNIPVIMIAGNHDFCGDKTTEGKFSSISNFSGIKNIEIVNTSLIKDYGNGVIIGYRAYTSNPELFLKDAAEMKAKGVNLLVAHQTFTGATYANGFFAEDGIDPALVPQDRLISGHIHSEQQIGKCWYPGTGKWDNANDANLNKGIWLCTHTENGYSKKFVSTEGVVTAIKKYTLKEGDETPELNPNDKNYLELEGTNAWIVQTKKKFKDTANLQIKAVPTDTRVTQNKANIKTISDFLAAGFKPINGVSLEQIQNYLGAI